MNELTFVWGVLVVLACLAGYLTLENIRTLGRLDRLEAKLDIIKNSLGELNDLPDVVNGIALNLQNVESHVHDVHSFVSRVDTRVADLENAARCFSEHGLRVSIGGSR